MTLLAKLVSLGGLLNGSKTILGLIAIVYYGVTTLWPEYKQIIDTILQVLGVALLPIGAAHKVVKELETQKK